MTRVKTQWSAELLSRLGGRYSMIGELKQETGTIDHHLIRGDDYLTAVRLERPLGREVLDANLLVLEATST